MISGATQVLRGMPADQVDPFKLAGALSGDSGWALVLGHQAEASDMLLLKGGKVLACARCTAKGHTALGVESVKERHRNGGNASDTQVRLFQIPDSLLRRALIALRTTPCIRIHPDRLSRRLVEKMLASTGCKAGILESYEFKDGIPIISLQEYNPAQGQVYDSTSGRCPAGPQPDRVVDARGQSGPAGRGLMMLYEMDETAARLALTLPPVTPPAETSASATAPIEQVPKEQLKLFSQPASSRPLAITLDETEDLRKAVRRASRRRPATGREEPQEVLGEVEAGAPRHPVADLAAATLPARKESETQDAPIVQLFSALLVAFRKKALEVLGSRYENIFQEGEKSVRAVEPNFDTGMLTATAAPAVLDFLDAVIKAAPFFKRPALRDAASVSIAGMYDRQYELLERCGLVDRVEEVYCRMKRK
jgi:hypothetical protein